MQFCEDWHQLCSESAVIPEERGLCWSAGTLTSTVDVVTHSDLPVLRGGAGSFDFTDGGFPAGLLANKASTAARAAAARVSTCNFCTLSRSSFGTCRTINVFRTSHFQSNT